MDDNQNRKRPEHTLRDGAVKASIWRNDGEKGSFYSTTFARTFQDQNGKPRDTQSFAGTDLLKVSELAREAYTHSKALRQEQAQAREGRREDFKQDREPSNQRQDRGPRR